MIAYNTLVVLGGTILLGASNGVVGTFAVLRGRALVGDALAHAALPGLMLAFLVMGERRLPGLLLGALLSGLVGVAAMAAIRRYTRVREDAALGIVLSVFFGAGIVLSRWIQNLTATGNKAGLDSYILGKASGMLASDVAIIAGVALTSALVVGLMFKELKLVAFDSEFAQVQGWPAGIVDAALMCLVAVNVVVGLPAAGVLLAAALLIMPAATARLWTDRLGWMVFLSAGLGAAIGAMGTSLSARYGALPTGPLIILSGAVLFVGSLLAAPRRGILVRWLEHRGRQIGLDRERLLRLMLHGQPTAREVLGWPAARHRRAWASLVDHRWLEPDATAAERLTAAGRAQAERVDRTWNAARALLLDQPESASNLVGLDAQSLEQLLAWPDRSTNRSDAP